MRVLFILIVFSDQPWLLFRQLNAKVAESEALSLNDFFVKAAALALLKV